MHDFTERLEELYRRWLNGVATDSEAEELGRMLEKPEVQAALAPLMKLAWQEKREAGEMTDEKLRTIATQIVNKHSYSSETVIPAAHRIHFLKTAWLRYAAAIVIVLGACAYFLFNQQKIRPSTATVGSNEDVSAPSSNQATLTLADGRQIRIDGSSLGVLAREANMQIQRNAGGEIVYNEQSAAVSAATQYNVLTVPRGGRIATMFLSDGTRVFLNSGSSLKYPVHFSGNERRVELSGEAYFEVAGNAKSKFVVSDGKVLTEVLGTSFNIHTYSDDAAANITLLTGAVKVSKGSEVILLKPGEQCVAADNSSLQVTTANIDEVLAWKNGYFQFEQATLSTIAKEVSRWYNVNFVFENKLAEKETFHAKFSRNSTLSELLKILEFTDVKFQIKGNEVIIK